MVGKALWLLGVSAASLAVQVPADAQMADGQDAADHSVSPVDSEDRSTAADQTGGAGLDASQVADVVVTARRRNELLQDVPIAVSAISGEIAARTGITNTEAITIATPSLDFSRQLSQGATPFLRGVGSVQAAAGAESPVAVYVDDVYIGSPNGNLLSLNNIASVQVLKGPQGTLFGRNATGGVIQVQTKRPDFKPSVAATLGYGNYDTVEGSLYATTGLGETVAVNMAASGRDQNDGFGRSLTTGVETQLGWDWDVRSQLLWNAGPSTRVLLAGDYGEQKSDFGTNSSVRPGTVSASGATFVGPFNTLIGTPRDETRIKQGGISLRVDQEASFADLVSISAYRKTQTEFSYDLDGGAAPVAQVFVVTPSETFSQEVQILSKQDSALKWIVGAYYFNSRSAYDPSRVGGLAFGGATFDTVDTQRLNSVAGFGEASYQVLPATNLTLGLRYTKDFYKLDVEGRFNAATGALLPGSTFRTKDSFPKLTYRAILDHKITPDVLAYASYSRGFKSGGYNLTTPGSAAAPAPAIRPEVLDAYEIGLKTKLFDDKLTLNGSAYYYDYRDLAVTVVELTGTVIVNAGAAQIKGFDLDFIAQPLPGVRLSGGLGVIDGEYTRFPNGPIFIPRPATCAPTPVELPGPRTGGNLQCTANLAGNTTQRSPKFTLSLSPSYTLDTGAGDFTLAATYYHNSGFFWDATNRLTQPSYDLVNGSLSWSTPDERFGVRIWARNLLDERYILFSSSNATRDQVAYAAPRTYGLTLSAKY